MSFSIGIVGLPNVGKSTLFKALTKKQVLIANYPFATIDPNVGVVEVPDERLKKLAEASNSKKVIPAIIEFYDIAGLVKNAYKGEGLGNQFLSHIKEVKAIVHLVRVFEDPDIHHVNAKVNPKNDIEIINLELCMADLQVIIKRLDFEKPKLKTGQNKDLIKRIGILERFKNTLEDEKALTNVSLTKEESFLIKDLDLLTTKPVIYVLNVSETSPLLNKNSEDLKKIFDIKIGDVLAITAKIESDISDLDENETKQYLETFGLKQSGLDKIILASYKLLDLITFLTSGPEESRAWTIRKGTKAPEAAGVIHSDFEKNFIRVEVINWKDFIEYGEVKCKEKGLMRLEGKNYKIQDGDVCYFRVNV